MKIKINDEWLKACGKDRLIGQELEVKSIRDFGDRGKFYTVVLPSQNIDWEKTWEVWDIRGITVIQ